MAVMKVIMCLHKTVKVPVTSEINTACFIFTQIFFSVHAIIDLYSTYKLK